MFPSSYQGSFQERLLVDILLVVVVAAVVSNFLRLYSAAAVDFG